MLKFDREIARRTAGQRLVAPVALALGLGTAVYTVALAQSARPYVADVTPLTQGIDDPRFETPAAETQASAAIDPVMAQGAGNHAKINRLRSRTGPSFYKPTEVCDTDVEFGADDDDPRRYGKREVYVGDVTVLAGGICPASQRNR